VQTCGDNATKRSGTLCGSRGENRIPNFGRSFVFDAKLSEFELIFPDPMHELDAGNCRSGSAEFLETEHRNKPKLNRSVILLDQIIQVF
jgi:hypothetical protein